MFSINSNNNNDAKSIMGVPISMTGMTGGMTLVYDGTNYFTPQNINSNSDQDNVILETFDAIPSNNSNNLLGL